MSDQPTIQVESCAGTTPEYGKWTAEQLRALVELSVSSYEGRMILAGCNSAVMAMAHRIALQTGGSYPWLCREIEMIVGGPRA